MHWRYYSFALTYLWYTCIKVTSQRSSTQLHIECASISCYGTFPISRRILYLYIYDCLKKHQMSYKTDWIEFFLVEWRTQVSQLSHNENIMRIHEKNKSFSSMEKCSFFMKHADGRDTIWTTSEPGPWFNIKIWLSYQYRKSHCEDNTGQKINIKDDIFILNQVPVSDTRITTLHKVSDTCITMLH